MRRAPLLAGVPALILAGAPALLLAACAGRTPDSAAPPKSAREVIEALEFPPLRFRPPVPERRRLSTGAPLLVIEDRTLPLVEVMVRFRGGASYFPRERLGAVSAMPSLLRSGGTRRLAPDSVDARIEEHAWRLGFGAGGNTSFASVAALTPEIGAAVDLWAEMLSAPAFAAERVELWRGRELEAARRRRDDPNFDAVSRFNELLYGDHPVGWVMGPDDIAPGRLAPGVLSATHAAIYCPENATFGVVGDIDADSAAAILDRAFAGWERCPGVLPDPPVPTVRSTPGVFVVHRPLAQATVYLGHGGGITRGDGSSYFASRIANAILGGSGLSSRIVRTLRTRLGLAYGAGTVWTTPRDHEGAFAAFTQTRADATTASVRAIFDELEGLAARPPDAEEVERAIDRIANGFVFNFSSPARIVARQMLYEAEGLEPDWLERYVDGIQAVEPEDVQRVVRARIHPSRMTLLVIGDTTAFDAPLGSLGLGDPRPLPDGR